MKLLENKFIIFILRLVIGGIFIYASIGKLFNPVEFGSAIRGYDILPLGIIAFLSVILPFLEFFSGTFLILGLFKRGSSFIIIVLLAVFLVGLGQAYARGLSIDCGCFSLSASQPEQGGTYLLIRIVQDILMLVGAMVIFYTENKIFKNKTININQQINKDG